MINILVLGSRTVIGSEYIRSFSSEVRNFIFLDQEDTDIRNLISLEKIFEKECPTYCINLVELNDIRKCNFSPITAFDINELGCKNVVHLCKKYDCKLIHISSNQVFDGKKSSYYKESDDCNSVTIYGKTKNNSEKYVIENLKEYVILRLPKVYGMHHDNFLLDMIETSKKTSEILVSFDFSDNYISAREVCKGIDSILEKGIYSSNSGIYHFSPKKSISDYDFFCEVFKILNIPVNLIPSSFLEDFKTPEFLGMDSEKFSKEFNFEFKTWIRDLRSYLESFFVNTLKVGYIIKYKRKTYRVVSVDWYKKEAVISDLNTETILLYYENEKYSIINAI